MARIVPMSAKPFQMKALQYCDAAWHSPADEPDALMTRTVPKSDWHPASWQALPAAQQPTYPDQAALEQAVAELGRLPPLVTSWEIDALKDEFARAERGEAFILQGGDCAETY